MVGKASGREKGFGPFARVELQPRELDHERLWLVVGGACGAAGALYISQGWSTPVCPLHLLTGWPCPGCGSTRAVLALARGEVGAALAWNPLATVVAGVVALWLVYALAVVVLRLPRWRWKGVAAPWPSRLRWLLAAAVAANWVWLVVDGR